MRTRPDGSLWRAVDETLERPVLVQAYALSHPYGGEIVDAARRAALVEDPRLQRVLAAGEERGTPYVVLERVPGRSLAELLQNGPLTAETARRITGEASQALDRAAARGLHHLRLRPTSLVVAPDGGVTVGGTAIDAAADGIASPSVDAAARSDAVGLVALLYATLTGRWPGTHDAGLARAPRVAGRPVPPGDLVAGVPNDLDTLCSVVLGPHDDGPRSPGDLAAQLAPWAAAAPLTDPRGLHLSAPARPGTGHSLPARPPAAARAGLPLAARPPTAGRPRRTAPSPDASAAPPPLADARAGESGAAGTAAAGAGTLAAGAAAAATGAGNPSNGGAPSTGRPGWATVDDLRRALRGAARGMGLDTGSGVPLAATPPPPGAPLADAPAPVGPPVEQPVEAPAPAPVAESPRRVAQAAAAARSRSHAAESAPVQPPAPTAQPPAADVPAADTRAADAQAATARPPASAAAAAPAERVRDRAPDPMPDPTPSPRPEPVRERPRDRGAEPVRERPADRAATAPSRPAAPAPAATSAPSPTRAAAAPASAPHARAAVPAWGGAPPSHPHDSSWDDAPTGGIDALDILGSVAHPEEPPVPFGPPAPLTRPPREQARLVVLVLAILLVVFGVFAVTRFVDFHPAPLINKGGGAPVPSGTGASSAAPAPSAAASSSAGAATPSTSPVSIAGAQALDPQGDDAENNDLVSRAIDGDPTTSWHSDHYSSPDFGGLKKGLGLAVDLGETSTVTSVTVTAPGTDGTLELRTADGPDLGGSVVVATGQLTGSGTVVLTPTKPVSTRELVLWFTRLPDSGDGRRAVVAEIDVR